MPSAGKVWEDLVQCRRTDGRTQTDACQTDETDHYNSPALKAGLIKKDLIIKKIESELSALGPRA